MINISDYLTAKPDFNNVQEVNNNPAILFSSTTGEQFGDIYIFKKFGIEKANSIKLSSQITTHYMEDNTARQDHWAIAPITYTLSGLVGELIYTPPKQWANFVQKNVINYLAPLGILSPSFDSYTQSAINTVQAVEASVNRYRQIISQAVNNIRGSGNTNIVKNNQGRILEWLENLRNNRQLVDVVTPYGRYYNLAISDILADQQDTKYQSNLEIQFVQWREISTSSRKATKEEQAEFYQCQNAPTEQIGTASTTKKSTFATRYDKGESLIQGLN